MIESTALEALTGEMLGDIGKLHRQVQELKAELPTILVEINKVIARLEAKTNAPQLTAQKELESFIRREIGGISIAGRLAREEASKLISGAINTAIDKGFSSVRTRSDKTFEDASVRFNLALNDSVEFAQSRALVTLKQLCQTLKNKIDEIRSERSKGNWVFMFGACTATGTLVGALSAYIFK